MRTPGPLPEGLNGIPFGRSTAADLDVPLGRLRRDDLDRPFHGVRVTDAPVTVLERCRAYAVRLRPIDVFSHITAAQLHGIPLPPDLNNRRAIDVAAVHPAAAPSTRGVIGHRLRNEPDAVLMDGLPVTGAAETWCQLGGLLELEDLVAAADFLLGDGRRPGLLSHEELRAAIDAPGRYRTAPLRRALALARPGSRSAQESRLRAVLVVGGLPEPALNAAVTSRKGRVMGHGDLVWKDARAVSEYEGEQHRIDPDQYAYDIRRYDEFQSEGWRLLRVVKDELRKANHAALVARARRTFGF